jgi:hypothetical protein
VVAVLDTGLNIGVDAIKHEQALDSLDGDSEHDNAKEEDC